MNRINYSILLLSFITLFSCGTEKKIIGLWQVEKVKMGEQEIARWTRFNKDQTQESGNGWFQHSIGTWQFNPNNKEIAVINSNGLKDEFGAFTLRMENEKMVWQREEDGNRVEVILKKIDQLPQSPANQLLGAWKLENKEDNANKKAISYLFFRWDRIVIDKAANQAKRFGTYKTHGHKNELQIIYYGDPLQQINWNYSFDQSGDLTLSGKRNGEKVDLQYKRIDYLPQ